MSDLQRSFAKSKLARLPPEPPPIFDENDEDDMEGEDDDGVAELAPRESLEDDSSSASSTSSTGTIKPSPSQHLFARSKKSVHPFPLVFTLP
jgi:protein phosphatase methylesterase 1